MVKKKLKLRVYLIIVKIIVSIVKILWISSNDLYIIYGVYYSILSNCGI